jgi:hypothetical protein
MAVEKPKSGKKGRPSAAATLYTSKIIKAGALLGDTKTLLAHWDESQTVAANLDRIRRENLFGKASRSRVEDILAIFRQRYLSDEAVTKALVILTKGGFPAAALDRILYFHAASADSLLHDAVTQILLPMHSHGMVNVDVADFEKAVVKWVNEGKTTTKWSDITIRRATQELLAALRDFGVLQGASNKRIAPAYVPIEAFAYLAFYLKQRQPSAAKLLELNDWKLFFLPREGVERSLIEAHQHNLLEYHVAGTVSRLTFPVETLEEYANVLASRTH